MIWLLIIVFIISYLFIGGLVNAALFDLCWQVGEDDFVEIMILWPVLLPVLLIMIFIGFIRTISEVVYKSIKRFIKFLGSILRRKE